MAIDPTAPVPSAIPVSTAGGAPDSVAVIQALARQALVNATAELGEIVGRPAVSPQGGVKAGTAVAEIRETSPRDARQAAEEPGAKPASSSTRSLVPAAPEAPSARVVRQAAVEAVSRQAGLAPLMADVRAAVARADTPPEVRQAGRALLAATPTAAQISTPQGLRRAVERSGVFLEAHLARAAAATLAGQPPSSPPSADLKAALLVFRGVLSAWLAKGPPPTSEAATPKVLPNHPEAEEDPPPDGTPRLARSPAEPASSAVTAARPITQSDVRPEGRAIPSSQAATTPAGSGEPPAPPPPAPESPRPDDEGLAARFAAFVSPPKPRSASASGGRPMPLSALAQVGLIADEVVAEEGAAENRAAEATPEPKLLPPRGYGATPAETARSKVPPPPFAGGPLAGQRPVAPELPADPSAVVRRLLKGADGAVARQDLMQIASLPRAADPGSAEVRQLAAGHLTFDMPFVTPQGVAVAQFEIGGDGGGAAGGVEPAERTYKARFSIDIEPLGPVHALVALTGARARVSLWAERAETIARLRDGEAILGAALRQAELTPEVAVHSGAPASPGDVSPLGHFVDEAS